MIPRRLLLNNIARVLGLDLYNGNKVNKQKLSMLLLADNNRTHANTVLDHIAMFTDLSQHDVRLFNPKYLHDSKLLNFNAFDAVIIHYSLVILFDNYLSSRFKARLKAYQGLKVQFIQDDYRWVDQIAATMRDLGIHLLFTLYPEEKIPKVWDETRLPGVAKYSTLAGYIPDNLLALKTPPLATRPIDIGYRGRTLPYWLGELGQEKVWIAQGVVERAKKYGLRCDIGWREEDRIYGRSWNEFLSSCKATLGTESGASITDFDGSLQRRVDVYIAEHPKADFFEVQRQILAPYENNVPINVISPRMFEAIALHTALILFPGEYSGILQPWVHYIPLAKDFSNMNEVAEKLNDLAFLQQMTQRAYQDVVASDRYSYRAFAKEFDELMVKHAAVGVKRHRSNGSYQFAQLERTVSLLAKLQPIHPKLHEARTSRIYFIYWVVYALKLCFAVGPLLLFAFLFGNGTVRELLWQALPMIIRLSEMRFLPLAGELLRLSFICQVQRDWRAGRSAYQIVAQFNEATGTALFTSVGNVQGETNGATTISPEGQQDVWQAIAKAWRMGGLRQMTWDHTAGQPISRYPVGRFFSLPFKIVEKSYSFQELVKLSHMKSR